MNVYHCSEFRARLIDAGDEGVLVDPKYAVCKSESSSCADHPQLVFFAHAQGVQAVFAENAFGCSIRHPTWVETSPQQFDKYAAVIPAGDLDLFLSEPPRLRMDLQAAAAVPLSTHIDALRAIQHAARFVWAVTLNIYLARIPIPHFSWKYEGSDVQHELDGEGHLDPLIS
jgi:hypothetical protein